MALCPVRQFRKGRAVRETRERPLLKAKAVLAKLHEIIDAGIIAVERARDCTGAVERNLQRGPLWNREGTGTAADSPDTDGFHRPVATVPAADPQFFAI